MNRTIDWSPEDALIFTRVVEEESFTAAARAVDMPKSTVSRRVSRLEEQLGVQLLRRTTRHLSLTDAGHAFYTRAVTAMEALAAAECAATETVDEPRGRLRVTAPAELGTRLFGAILRFSTAHPQVQLELDLTNRYVDLIEEGYDVALRGGRAPEGALSGRSLGTGEVHLVASSVYLDERGTPRRLRDLAKHDCVLFPRWVDNGAWTLFGTRGEVRVPVSGRLTITNLEAVRLAALEGHGLTLLPQSHCEADLRAGSLRRVLAGYCARSAGLWIVYSRTRFLSAKIRAFVDFVRAEFSDA
ncbi:MAG: LysR family transcriptional regulator [Planctomycetota bacterium]|jgi:DNA-binding transcriptional LysR family regulator